jgi:predicted metal-dependent peptidase
MATKIEKAKTQIVFNHAFYACILLRRPIVVTRDIPTAGINREGQIYVNPDFIEPLSNAQVQFLLLHECWHWLKMSFLRKEWRDDQLWNTAEDAVINESLVAEGFEFVPGGVRFPGADHMSGEEVYEKLKEKAERRGRRGDEGTGTNGEDGWGKGDMMDEGEPMSPDQARQLEIDIKQEIISAAEAARNMGELSGAIKRLVDSILYPKTPWHQILERWMTLQAKNDYCWHKPNKRHAWRGIVLPTLDGVGMGEVSIIVDTSGSIGQTELNHFNAHVNRIFDLCQPSKINVIYADSAVAHVDEYESAPVTLEPHGGGGTDMRVPVRYVEQHFHESQCIVMLTDGYTPWPDAPPDIPMIVASTTTAKAPDHVAETVRLEVE